MSNKNQSESRTQRARGSKKESTQDLLNNIKKAKESGTVYREEFVEQNVYECVTEEEYESLRAQRRQENIVDDGEYFDDGEDLMDGSDEEKISTNNKRKKDMKPIKNSNIKRLKSEIQKKTKDGNLIAMMKKSQISNKPIDGNFDDILAELQTPISEKKKKKKKSENFTELETLSNKNLIKEKKSEKSRFKIHSKKSKNVLLSEDQILTKVKTLKNNSKEFIPIKTNVVQNEPVLCSIKTIDDNNLLSTLNNSIPTTEMPTDKSEIDDFMDIDFDESCDDEKCISEPKASQLQTMLWDDDTEYGPLPIDNTSAFTNIVLEDNQTQIYWIDAYYDSKIKGSIFIFGKTYDKTDKKFVSCCVKISGLERRLYFLPNNNYDFTQVHKEVLNICEEYKIDSFRCKKVTKKYAFQLADVPNVAEYMMVKYDAKNVSLPMNLTGETFSHVFGCETSILELFILDLKLKGPCWMNFSNLKFSDNKFSTCKLNYEINGIIGITKCLEKLPNPPLTLLSLNIKTVVNSKTNSNEIVSIGYFIHNEVYFDQPPPKKVFQEYFTILTQPKDMVMPYDLKQKLNLPESRERCKSVNIVPNERALINNFLASMHKNDPDMIVGHSLFGHQLFILLQRCQSLNIGTWYKMGRLIRNITLPKLSSTKSNGWIERMASAGRFVCDIEFSGRELVKCRSYELSDMVKEILPPSLHGLQNQSKISDLNSLFKDSNGVKQLIDITLEESLSSIYLMHELQILPLVYQITAICGNLIAKTLSSGKSERNEYLLLHAFNEKDYITPDKYSATKDNKNDILTDETAQTSRKKKPTYLGGLVLEPKKGFYEDFILLMDFNSLYPSIIQELNICFTTIDRQAYLNDIPKDITMDNDVIKINKLMELATNGSDKPLGILPTEIKKLVESRQQIKNLLKESGLSQSTKIQYDIRQKALKITANSMYGCLGFSQSRFQATQLASLITCKGRDILQKTKKLVESNKINSIGNLDIVYGDTDSIMVRTPFSKISDFDAVMNIGKKIKQEINKQYKFIQIDIDGVFQKLLLLKKKKYAALTVTKNPTTNEIITKQELKGLDIVRRDWCKLSVDVGHEVVTKILEGNMSYDDLRLAVIEYLGNIKDEINNEKVLLDKFVITKALARNPENYTNVEGQSHVQVALRYNKSGSTKKFKAQDTVEYVICEDGSNRNAAQRAYSVTEIKNSKGDLKIDSHYYLSHQLHPVISRLVDVIEGLGPDVVASCLGLESKIFIKNIPKENDVEQEINDRSKFNDCKPLSIVCLKCRHTNDLMAPISSIKCHSTFLCSSCDTDIILNNETHILNTITRSISFFVKSYYQQVYTCQDVLCNYTCRQVPIFAYKDNNTAYDKLQRWLCPHCGQGVMSPVIDDAQLYLQLIFFKSLFADVQDSTFMKIQKHIDLTIKNSAYAYVSFSNLNELFRTLYR